MDYYLALLIPIIVTVIFYFFRKNKFTWWEFFIPIAVIAITILISKLIIDTTSVTFTEYWGSTITAVYEEEPYNYWHQETCSYTTCTGTGKTQVCITHYYDCSHQDDVGPSWKAVTNIGEEFSISERVYDQLIKQFKTKRVIIKLRSNHDPDDYCVSSKKTKFAGKKVGKISYIYETRWNGNDETRKAYTSKHHYKNKIKATDLSIFNISIVNEKQADSLGLFRYPEYNDDGLEYPTILGKNISSITQEKFKRLNGKFGISNELRLWILIFENKPLTIARQQENFWVKGNMNEFVLCIGKKGNQIQWAHTFSWALSNELTIDIRNKVMNLYQFKDTIIKIQQPPVISKLTKKVRRLNVSTEIKDSTIRIKFPSYPVLNEITWDELYKFLNKNLNKYKRRDFREFDYLTVEPPTWAIIIIYVIAIIISVGINLWIIKNNFED